MKNIKKSAVNTGVMTSGHNMQRPKKLGCSTKCPRKCIDNFSHGDRESIFEKFWGLADKERQRQFILQYTAEKSPIKRQTGSRRKISRNYFLPNVNCQIVQVCGESFLASLGINYQWIRTAYLENKHGGGVLTPDLRGKHPVKKMQLKSRFSWGSKTH